VHAAASNGWPARDLKKYHVRGPSDGTSLVAACSIWFCVSAAESTLCHSVRLICIEKMRFMLLHHSGGKALAGEWVGKSAAFSATGEVQPLLERYVPPEFAQWDIVLCDWATASSFKVHDEILRVQTKYMLPTVGTPP
jgi:hypothetical protein